MLPDSIDVLTIRFGTVAYYEDWFQGFAYYDPKISFKMLGDMKKSSERHEAARQQFLRLLGQHKMVWQPTNRNHDINVEISRIYRENEEEYIAFMRIRPRGFRAERVVSANMEIVFHLLMGRAVFIHKKKARTMYRGHNITVAPRTTYAIRCLGSEPAYFVFRINQHTKPTRETKVLAIEAPPKIC